MKKYIFPIVCIGLAVLWMTVIFVYSAQHAEQSSQNSAGIVDRIIEWTCPDYQDLSAEEQLKINNTITLIVRKGAHMGEYAVLAILLYAMCTTLKLFSKPRMNCLMPFGVTVLFAATDELHQRFVPGRSGELRDILIDACGAALGILIACGVAKMIRRMKKESSEE